MIAKKYSSFEEIDDRLRIVKLQKDISSESFKFNLKKSKETFYPSHVFGEFSGVIQKVLLGLVLKKIIKKFT
ncbi:DUF6327 family protein [Flavobacteriaceae bacterium KMM 6897]|nr:DUF6327 family protein [Flavobacteriaceae bacterium KMM 6897]MEB8346260.1 DUF6327 family protein [Flavobacteriaceae bacterium KMM 6898]